MKYYTAFLEYTPKDKGQRPSTGYLFVYGESEAEALQSAKIKLEEDSPYWSDNYSEAIVKRVIVMSPEEVIKQMSGADWS